MERQLVAARYVQYGSKTGGPGVKTSQSVHSAGRRHVPQTLLIASALLIGAVLSLNLHAGMAHAASLGQSVCVNPGGTGGCYATIQAAVNAASPGATVSVAAGTYAEDVQIQKPLRLQGAGAATTTIDATGLDHGIVVQGVSGGEIAGFTVENANLAGIQLTNVAWLLVDHNTVQGNDRNLVPAGFDSTCAGAAPFEQEDCGEGVYLQGVSFSTFAHNLVQNNAGGFLVTDETGPTHDNMITNNTVRNNVYDCGITLPSHPTITFGPSGPVFGPGYGVYSNTVSHNVSTGNGTHGGGAGAGIFDPTPGTAAYNNTIVGNVLTNNGMGGVALHSHAPGQNLNGNTIVGNIISGNGPDEDAGTPGSVGIVIFADASAGAAPIQGTTVVHNTISNEAVGVFVGRNDTSVLLRANDLGGTTVGVDNAGTGTADAKANYWGCTGGPGATGCSAVEGTVLFTPWLKYAPGN